MWDPWSLALFVYESHFGPRPTVQVSRSLQAGLRFCWSSPARDILGPCQMVTWSCGSMAAITSQVPPFTMRRCGRLTCPRTACRLTWRSSSHTGRRIRNRKKAGCASATIPGPFSATSSRSRNILNLCTSKVLIVWDFPTSYPAGNVGRSSILQRHKDSRCRRGIGSSTWCGQMWLTPSLQKPSGRCAALAGCCAT